MSSWRDQAKAHRFGLALDHGQQGKVGQFGHGSGTDLRVFCFHDNAGQHGLIVEFDHCGATEIRIGGPSGESGEDGLIADALHGKRS